MSKPTVVDNAEAAALEKIRAAASMDTERGHVQADDALCELLEALGFRHVVKEYRDIDKWFS